MKPTPRGPQSLIQLKSPAGEIRSVPAITIIQDTREQLPYAFAGFKRVSGTIVRTLETGDYAILEAEAHFRAERKRVDELFSTLSNNLVGRARFIREMERMLAFPIRHLIIEGTPQQIKQSGLRSGYHPHAVLGSLDAITTRYGVHVVFCDTRDEAEERLANLAAMAYAYYYAAQHGLGPALQAGDL